MYLIYSQVIYINTERETFNVDLLGLLTCPPKPGPQNKLGKGQKKTYTQEKAGHMDLLEEWLISLQP